MTSPQLENLAKSGSIKVEPASAREIERLLRLARVRLADAQKRQNAFESRFDLAYSASHAAALAALRWHGYRSENRYLVFQCLQHTLGVEAAFWRVLALCHERRNRAEYEGDFEVDEQLLADLIRIAKMVLDKAQGLGPPGETPQTK